MPWSNDGSGEWNSARCSPIDPNPGALGDACAVEGNAASGVDDCELATMCFHVDPQTNMGTCVALCEGQESNPLCDDPATACAMLSDGWLNLCLQSCDPLESMCPGGQVCAPTLDSFSCVPAQGTEDYGEPCVLLGECLAGLVCLPGAMAGCPDDSSCCTTFCELGDGDPNPLCPDAAIGQECLPWYVEGESPPRFVNTGACGYP